MLQGLLGRSASPVDRSCRMATEKSRTLPLAHGTLRPRALGPRAAPSRERMLSDMDAGIESFNLHTPEPSVYLDQWVWIRLALAAAGRPRERIDSDVLTSVTAASAKGIAFPLPATHYMETAKISDPAQRADIARVMAPISRRRTLRASQELLRHQFLYAMHLSFGRPTFRPVPPQVLGFGAWWAISGREKKMHLTVHGARVMNPEIAAWEAKVQQLTEFMMLAGPGDDELEDLRNNYGYQPERTEEVSQQRLDWESTYVGLLADDPVSRAELRVRVQAREVIHEHLSLFGELLRDYQINLDSVLPPSSREKMVEFADRIPSVRIAVDLKAELFRNESTAWRVNHLHDIDAMSLAVPYCHVVVPDKQIADLLSRSRAGERHQTTVVRRLADLPAILDDLISSIGEGSPAESAEPFCVDIQEIVNSAPDQSVWEQLGQGRPGA